MGSEIPKKQNEIFKRLNSFFEKNRLNDEDSIETLEKNIKSLFSSDELKKIYDEDDLKDFFWNHKKKVLNDIKREREHREEIRKIKKDNINQISSIIKENQRALNIKKAISM